MPEAEQQSLWHEFSRARRKLVPLDPNREAGERNKGVKYFAANPSQKLTARFLDASARIGSVQQGSNWGTELKVVAIGGKPTASPELHQAADDRIEYRHADGVVEWYANQEAGLEHGITLAHRPAHSDQESLSVSIAVTGATVRSPDDTGTNLEFDSAETGSPLLSYSHLLVTDASGNRIPAHMRPAEGGFEILVADASARYPLTIDPMFSSLEGQWGADITGDGANNAWFGSSVTLSDDGLTALIGARSDPSGTVSYAGSAYVFTRAGGVWTWQAKLAADVPVANDQFGFATAISGDTALVSAPYHDTGGTNTGSCYIFKRSGATWTLEAKVDAADAAANDNFGTAVALSGDTALIGAAYDDTSPYTNSGSAYVFTRTGTTWSQQSKLVAGDPGANDGFGISVALSGDTALIGCPGDDLGAKTDSGGAYVFTRSGTTWTQQARLNPDDAGAGDAFGGAVALSGDTALIGAAGDDTTAGTDAGSSYIFTRSGSIWTQQYKLTAGDGKASANFGSSVSLSADTALIGTVAGGTNTPLSNAGCAYIFTRNGSTWTQQAQLIADDTRSGDYFGCSVAMAGDTALIGARSDSTSAASEAGSAYVFTRNGTTWTQLPKLTAGDPGNNDNVGATVAISGNTVVVGAPYDTAETGYQTGSLYVFSRTNNTWTQQARLQAPDGLQGDQFASCVAIDGDTLAVAAIGGDSGATIDTGAVYIFTRIGTSWSQTAKLTPGNGLNTESYGCSVALKGDTLLVGAYGATAQSVPTAGAAYVYTRSGAIWSQRAKLVASDPVNQGMFGASLSLSSDTALIGSPRSSNGAAYVFVGEGASWAQQSKLTVTSGFFGASVAVSGNTALVGLPSAKVGTQSVAGQVNVYVRNGLTWSLQTTLSASDAAASDEFGHSVALSGDTALVGAYLNNLDSLFSDTGCAYVFSRANSVWTQQLKLAAPDAVKNDRFGSAVALEGDTAVVGAPGHDVVTTFGRTAYDQGKVYTYRLGTPASKLSIEDQGGSTYPTGGMQMFGTTAIGGSTSSTLVMRNSGTADLTYSAFLLSGAEAQDFSQDVPAGGTLAPGASMTFHLTFSPSGSGFRHTVLYISNNDPAQSVFTLQLSGTGNTPPGFSGFTTSTSYQTPVTITAANLLAAASDADGDTISLAIVDAASTAGGSVALGSNVTYTPPQSFSGTDTFHVTLQDNRGATASGIVTVQVGTPPGGTGQVLLKSVITMNGGTSGIQFHGLPNTDYILQRSIDDMTTWQDVRTFPGTPEGIIEWTETITPPPSKTFYRFRAP